MSSCSHRKTMGHGYCCEQRGNRENSIEISLQQVRLVSQTTYLHRWRVHKIERYQIINAHRFQVEDDLRQVGALNLRNIGG